MDITSHLEKIEKNWHNREHNCSNCPKWHTAGFKRPFFGAGPKENIEADVVFVGEEPGTGGKQAHEDWREKEQISIDEAADRVAQSTWDHRDFPVSDSAMFTDELLEVLAGNKTEQSSTDLPSEFDYYITNLEKCHEGYTDPDSDEYDEDEYIGDQLYEGDYSTNKSATDCCSSYLRTELDLLQPQIVVTLGVSACEGLLKMYDGFGPRPALSKDPFTVLESDEADWKLVPAMHPSPRNLNGSYSFSDIDLPSGYMPEDAREARRMYYEILRGTLLGELNL